MESLISGVLPSFYQNEHVTQKLRTLQMEVRNVRMGSKSRYLGEKTKFRGG